MTTVAGTVPAAELAAGLAAVIPHIAPKTESVEQLQTVRLEARDGTLTLAATDRYTFGSYRLKWNGPDFEDLIDRSDAKEILRAAKKIKVGDITLEKRPAGLMFQMNGTLNITASIRWGDYPNLGRIVPKLEDRSSEGITTVVFNPTFIARFAHASKTGDEMIMSFYGSPTRPVRVDIGDYFTGMIMPTRLNLKAGGK